MKKFYIFFFLFFAIILTPPLGALDRATTQWFFLSFLPLFFYRDIEFKFKSFVFLVYIFFIIQVVLSLLYTNNFSISIIDTSRHIIILFLVTIILGLLNTSKSSFYYISFFISVFLVIESLFSIFPLLSFFYENGILFSKIISIDLDQFKGITGNRNITTASIVIKLPFLFYTLYRVNYFYKPILGIISSIPLITLFIINSRAALLSFLFIVVFVSIYFIFLNPKKIQNLVYILVFSSFSFFISKQITQSTSKDTLKRLSTINFSNESSSQRLFLWENALDYISNNPFIGCGIGNWKVESSAYWGSLGTNYLVPYHAHNDFLEFSTELGLIGGLTYFSLFVLMGFIFLRLFISSKDFKFLVLLLSLSALFIDSFLNFPFERPIIQTLFVLLLAFSIHYNLKVHETKV